MTDLNNKSNTFNAKEEMNEESFVEGYVHAVSSVRTAANKQKSQYFDCTMQVSENETQRLVCYSPKKRMEIQDACQKNSPVKIIGTKRKISKFSSSEDKEILKSAKIMPTTLDYQYDKELFSNLLTVKQCLDSSIYATVDMKVKVITKNDTKQPIIHNKQTKYKCDCNVADASQSIKLILWEDAIDKVQVGKSYHIQNLKVRIFDDIKFVNSNESTLITEIEDIGDIDLSSPELEDNIIKAQCIGIDIKKTLACIACNNATSDEDENDEDEDDYSDTITCPSCKITILKSAMKTKVVSQLLLSEKGKIATYKCFTDAIDSFLTHQNRPDVTNMDVDELKNLMLHAGEQKMVVDKSQKLVYQFLP